MSAQAQRQLAELSIKTGIVERSSQALSRGNKIIKPISTA